MTQEQKQQEMSKDEQIGFHKGSLSVLAKEREELLKIVNITEQLMQMHVKALKEQGVDLQQEADTSGKKKDKPIEDMV